ncbi:MAG: hypothetical protein K0Q76_1683 [Panacagrimonas sp.]|nr:hypothetical protein [Panacagrimonas sp.]
MMRTLALILKVPAMVAILALSPVGSACAGLFDWIGTTKRTESLGPFEVTEVKVPVHSRESYGNRTEYHIHFRGKPVVLETVPASSELHSRPEVQIDQVARFDSAQPALLVWMDGSTSKEEWNRAYLLSEDATGLRVQRLLDETRSVYRFMFEPFHFRRLDQPPDNSPKPEGWPVLTHVPGASPWLLAGLSAAVDLRTMSVVRFPAPPLAPHEFEPVTVSPDGQSFARWSRFGYGDSRLIVFELPAGTTYAIELDPNLLHAVKWRPKPGGGFRLTKR